MGTLFRVKRLFKRLSSAVLRLLLGYPLNPIDSPCSPTGWAKTGLFIRGAPVELLDVWLEDNVSLLSLSSLIYPHKFSIITFDSHLITANLLFFYFFLTISTSSEMNVITRSVIISFLHFYNKHYVSGRRYSHYQHLIF